jgi:hypothetical protein
MTNEQLDFFAKLASQSYIEEGTDMNNTIIKIAEEHALNKHEIDRVVEQSNINTHLALFGKLDDKYVEFPVADAEKIANELSTISTSESLDYDDYNSSPEQTFEEVSIFPVEDVEKIASDKNDVWSAESINLRTRIKYANDMLESQLSEADQRFTGECEKFYHMVKQAVLQGTLFGHIKQAAEQHRDGYLTSLLFKTAKEKLGNESKKLDLSDTTEKLGMANKNNEILQQIDIIYEKVGNYEDLQKKYGSLWKATGEIAKTVGGLGSRVGRALFGTRKRAIRTGLEGGGGLLIGGTAYQVGKDKSDYENSILRNARKPQ